MLLFDFHNIGNRLLTFRKRSGMTQGEVAEKAGPSDRTYADIERGTVNMRIETLLRICKALHITPDEVLLTETDTASESDCDELIDRLKTCSAQEQRTALMMLDIYLKSLGK